MNTKPWYRSKTVWVTLGGGLLYVLAQPELAAALPASWQPAIVGATFVLNLVLRASGGPPLALRAEPRR
jgi:hypothetical protein